MNEYKRVNSHPDGFDFGISEFLLLLSRFKNAPDLLKTMEFEVSVLLQ